MSDIADLRDVIPTRQLAGKLGVDEATASSAIEKALPSLLAGLQRNAQDARGEQSLLEALNKHARAGTLDGGVDVDQIDVADGEKIVGHVLGGSTDSVAAGLAGGSGSLSPDLIKQVLPVLAPIVLGYLAKKVVPGSAQAPAQAPAARADAGLGGLLGSVLGDAGGGAGGGIADLLGGLLGGKR